MTKKQKILIVDDSPEWLRHHISLIKRLFGEDFFEINTAASGKQRFNKVLQEKDYNLVITDLEMEKIFDESYAGVWLVKNLLNRKETENTKFLIISGAYNVWNMANSLKVDHIEKSSLLDNPLILKYKIEELLKLA